MSLSSHNRVTSSPPASPFKTDNRRKMTKIFIMVVLLATLCFPSTSSLPSKNPCREIKMPLQSLQDFVSTLQQHQDKENMGSDLADLIYDLDNLKKVLSNVACDSTKDACNQMRDILSSMETYRKTYLGLIESYKKARKLFDSLDEKIPKRPGGFILIKDTYRIPGYRQAEDKQRIARENLSNGSGTLISNISQGFELLDSLPKKGKFKPCDPKRDRTVRFSHAEVREFPKDPKGIIGKTFNVIKDCVGKCPPIKAYYPIHGGN